MENKKLGFSVSSVLLFSFQLTLGLFICCLISMGVGHGSSILFKLAFPLSYALFEFLYEKGAVENSIVAFFIAGLIQNLIYFSVVERLKSTFSYFISYSIIIGLHLILFVIVNQIYE